MYTDEAAKAGASDDDQSRSDAAVADLFSQRCADDPHHRVPRGAGAVSRCTAAPGMFGGHSVHVSSYADVRWALQHPEVFSSKDVVDIGNDAPLIPLSVDPPEHAQVPAHARPRVLTEEDDGARARSARARERDHRPLRRQRRVRVPRRLRDAAAVDDLPRARRAPAERPARLPALARRHDPARGHDARGGRAEAPGRGRRDQRLLRDGAGGEARAPRRPAAQPRSRPARSTAGRSPSASSSACATCCCSAGSTPSRRRSTA